MAKLPQSGFCWNTADEGLEVCAFRDGSMCSVKTRQIPEVVARLQLGTQSRAGWICGGSSLKSPPALIYLSNTCKRAGMGCCFRATLIWARFISQHRSPLMPKSSVPMQQIISDALNCSVSLSTAGFRSHVSLFLAVSRYYNTAKPCELIITSRHR